MTSEKIVRAVARGFMSGHLMSCCLLVLLSFIVVLLSATKLSALFIICLRCDGLCIDRCVGAKPFTDSKATDKVAAAAGMEE